MKAVGLLALVACATIEGRIVDGGTVFVCDGYNPDGSRIEFCWNGDLAELEDRTGMNCHASRPWDRTSIVGCWYHCAPSASGCNAHNSCFCDTTE